MQEEIRDSVKEIYGAQDRTEAEARLKKIVEKLKDKAPKFCDWLEENSSSGAIS